MKCFLCKHELLHGPTGLTKYRSTKRVGITNPSRKMSPEPKGVDLVLIYENDKIRRYCCPECRITVTVQKKIQDATNSK